MKFRIFGRCAANFVALSLLGWPINPPLANATFFTWQGTGSNGNWGDPFQWAGFSAPPVNGVNTDIVLAGSDSSPDIQSIINTDVNYNIDSLTLGSFYSGGGTMFLSGGELRVTDEIVNSNAHELEFNSKVKLGDAFLDINASGSTIDFDAPLEVLLPNSFIAVVGGNVFFDAGITTSAVGLNDATLRVGSSFVRIGGNSSPLGQVDIQGGTLQIASFSSLDLPGTVDVNVGSGGTFDLNNNQVLIERLTGTGVVELGSGLLTFAATNNTDFTYGGRISGTGGIRYFGNKTMTLTRDNNYTGSTVISEGVVRLSGGGRLSHSTLLSIGASGTFDLNGVDDEVSAITGSGTIRLRGGKLTFGEATGTRTFSGDIIEAGELIKQEAGTLILSGDNTFNALTVAEGVVQVSSAENLGVGGVNLGRGVFSPTPSVLQVTASMTNSRPINLLNLRDSDTPSEIVVDPGVTLTQTGIIGGGTGRSLNKKGSGTLILAAFNTYRGNTNLLEGTIRLGLSNQIRDQSWVLVEAGTTLDLDNNSESVSSLRGIGGTVDTGGPLGRLTVVGDQFGTFFWGGDITGSGGFTKAGFHTLEITTPQSFTGRTVISKGELRFGSDGAFADDSDITIDSPGGWNLNGQDDRVDSIQGDGIIFLGGAKLVVDEAGTGTRLFGGGLGGAGNFVKAGTHTLILSGLNAVTGTTTLEAGVLQVASSTHLGDGTVVFDGGTLRSTDSLTNTRPVNVNASQTGMVDVNAGTTFTQAGAITGSGSTTLIKLGTGTLRTTVPFASGFQGDIRIDEGTFDLAGTGNAIGNSTRVTVNQPGTFLVNNPDDIGSIAGNGSIVLNEILRVGLDDTSSTFAGVISGSGLFGKRGTGTMTLAGENSYSGITDIDNGILKLSGNGRLSDATDLEISAGATLLLEGVVDSIDSISGAGAIQLGAPFTTSFNVLTIGAQNGTATFSGSISSNLIGAGQLVKAGLGTQTLTGHSTHPNTTVQSGTLILSDGGSIDQLGLSIGNGAALLATAVVDGNATTWQLAADLDVGRFSPGRLEINNGAVVTVDGDVNIGSGAEEGTLSLDNGVLDNSSGNGIRIAKGSLQGSGEVLGNLVNKDTVSPGLSAGVLNLTGDFFQTDVGTLAIEIAGIDNSNLQNPQFDVLAIKGEAQLEGLLEVSLLDNFLPSSGDTFAMLTATAGINGTFNAAKLPKLPKGLDWSINYAADKVLLEVLTLLATDTEPDGDVDGADFLALQRDNPALIPTWQTEYGSGGNLLAASQQVPEPNGLLLIAGLIGIPYLRRRARTEGIRATRRGAVFD